MSLMAEWLELSLSDMKYTVMIWRSWVRTPDGIEHVPFARFQNLNCIRLKKFTDKKCQTFLDPLHVHIRSLILEFHITSGAEDGNTTPMLNKVISSLQPVNNIIGSRTPGLPSKCHYKPSSICSLCNRLIGKILVQTLIHFIWCSHYL